MRRHQLLVAGISVALLVGGAAAPALAYLSSPGQVNGSGRTANVAYFSVKVREDRLGRGYFTYTSVDGRHKVRCDGFNTFEPRMYVVPGPPAARVTAQGCVHTGPNYKRTRITLDAEFVDNSSFKRGAKDEANLTFIFPGTTPPVTDTGRILSGDIVVR